MARLTMQYNAQIHLQQPRKPGWEATLLTDEKKKSHINSHRPGRLYCIIHIWKDNRWKLQWISKWLVMPQMIVYRKMYAVGNPQEHKSISLIRFWCSHPIVCAYILINHFNFTYLFISNKAFGLQGHLIKKLLYNLLTQSFN